MAVASLLVKSFPRVLIAVTIFSAVTNVTEAQIATQQAPPAATPTDNRSVGKLTPPDLQSSIWGDKKITNVQNQAPSRPPQTPIKAGTAKTVPAVSPPAASAVNSRPIDEEMMIEIQAIRAQLGGGISKSLQGMELPPTFGSATSEPPDFTTTEKTDRSATTAADNPVSPDDLFNQQLRSVMSEQKDTASTLRSPSTPAPTDAIITNHSNAALQSNQRQPNPDRIDELRSCARRIEELAARLEALQAYPNADALRLQASKLWTAARQQ